MNTLALFVALFALLMPTAGIVTLGHRSVYRTEQDPTGRYTAVVSYRSYLSLLPGGFGDGSGKPGFVEIFDESRASLGEVPLPMLFQASPGAIQWKPAGAWINVIAEWDFSKGTCCYHDDDDDAHFASRCPVGWKSCL